MRVPPLCLALTCLAGCNVDGSFQLVLTLPSAQELRPTGMTTVTVVLTPEGEQPIATTSVLESNKFSTGDLSVADNVRVEVQLRDVSNRLVGVGEAADPVDIVAGDDVEVTIPVRRPFVYATNGMSLFSFDPTLDPTNTLFQGQVSGVSAPQVVVSVGGDRLAIVSSNQLSVLTTDTNKLVGTPITLPGTTRDASAIPGTHKVAVAHDQGIAIVDLDNAQVANAMVGPVDRVTVGPSADGRLIAHGLVGRVTPALNPLVTCGGSSSLVSIDVDAPAAATPKPLPQPVSDIAAAPENVGLFATLPCANKVVKLTGDIEGGAPAFSDFAPLDRAAVLAVAGGRVWAAGTKASVPNCTNQFGGQVACTPDSPALCPPPGTAPPSSVDYVREGAHMIVQSIPLDGGTPITLDLPGRRETIFDIDDPANQHAQVLRAFGAVPLDLVALPGGQYVGLVATSNYYIQQLSQGTNIILPCLDATTSDWLLLDMASSSIAQRVRTSCALVVGPANDFPNWACDEPPVGERSSFGEYVPVSVGALFGAR
ncbi:MAG TPA: hypothetical protein VFQ53_19750 [Kofleriaceae bacterium]|nr:hypothetical protein [Kofleriaceae bacterium]